VIHTALSKLEQRLEESQRTALTGAAGVGERENFKLHALGKTIRDLTRRIERRAERIEQFLRDELARQDEVQRGRRLQEARTRQANARVMRDKALQALLEADERIGSIRREADAVAAQRQTLMARHVEAGRLKAELETIDGELAAEVQTDSAPIVFREVAPAGSGRALAEQFMSPVLFGVLAMLGFLGLAAAFGGRANPT
jgi:hypothetical protein